MRAATWKPRHWIKRDKMPPLEVILRKAVLVARNSKRKGWRNDLMVARRAAMYQCQDPEQREAVRHMPLVTYNQGPNRHERRRRARRVQGVLPGQPGQEPESGEGEGESLL